MLNNYEKVVVCCRIKNRIAYVRVTMMGTALNMDNQKKIGSGETGMNLSIRPQMMKNVLYTKNPASGPLRGTAGRVFFECYVTIRRGVPRRGRRNSSYQMNRY